MPHLMNCPHAEEGWCLNCVKELHERSEKYFGFVVAIAKNRLPFSIQDSLDAHTLYQERRRLTTSGTQK
jgi:hypothetical protein